MIADYLAICLTEWKLLVEMIPTGSESQNVLAAIAWREARLREITDQAVEPGQGPVQEQLGELRAFAISRLNRLRDVVANSQAIHQARTLLAEQVGKFTLERVSEDGRISYKANGEIDFFGEAPFPRADGAGGTACTESS